MEFDQAAVHRARPDNHRIAFPGNGNQPGRFFDGRRKVSIGEQNCPAARLEHPVTNAVSLAAILTVGERPEVGIARGQFTGKLQSSIGRAVVHDDDLRAKSLVTQPGINLLDGVGKTALFIVGGDDDGESDVGVTHANRIFR